MVTKIAFVVVSSPNAHYIEMALLAVFSARYWNPQAHIVLLVDDKTDALLVNERATILEYVSEKIVIPFSEDKSAYYRSRWIKTNLLRLIGGGGMLFYCDSDVIITRSLEEIDGFSCKIGAVPDAHLPVKDYCKPLADKAHRNARVVGVDLNGEMYYFNSGAIYVKICKETLEFYDKWHWIWKNQPLTLTFDQPALTKANINCEHLIECIPDRFNCLMYTHPDFADNASILHFAGVTHISWLYSPQLFDIIQNNGIPEWLIPSLKKPTRTYFPFQYNLYKMSWKELRTTLKEMTDMAVLYGTYVDAAFTNYPVSYFFKKEAKWLLIKKKYYLAIILALMPKWVCLKLHIGKKPIPNIKFRDIS